MVTMNRGTGRFFFPPAQEAIDVDDIVDVTADEHYVTQSRSETAEISNAPSSSPSEDETSDAELLKPIADAWMKDSDGIKKATCWRIFSCTGSRDSRNSERVPVYCWVAANRIN